MKHLLFLLVVLMTGCHPVLAHDTRSPAKPAAPAEQAATVTTANICPATHPHLRFALVAGDKPACNDIIDTRLVCGLSGCTYERKAKTCRPNAQLLCLSDAELKEAEQR